MPNDRRHRVLIGEDEPEVRSYLEVALRCQGFAVEAAEDGEEVISCLQNHQPVSAVLLDLLMPRKDGMETLRDIRRINRSVPIIIVSGACSPLNVVEAMKSGATDFLGKPINHEDLIAAIRKAIDGRPAPGPEIHNALQGSSGQTFFGGNPAMRELEALIAQVGWSDAPVLIQGETGSGKEVLAREIHAASQRASRPMLKLNCAALPSELVESELFGYERGAFTGAFQRKPGMFEQADGGTILLDEIGDMEFKLQAKLLQVLQDNEFQRLGGKETIRVDVRVIAATHNDLEANIANGSFRADLYYRLNVISLRLPALRQRRDDILSLTEFLLKKHSQPGMAIPPLTAALRQELLNHDWPGNIRELENVVRKLLIIGNPEAIASELRAKAVRRLSMSAGGWSAPQHVPETAAPPILEQVTRAKRQAEIDAILAALHSTRWNRKKAAGLLNIDYKALLYKMKKLGIEDSVISFPGEPHDDQAAKRLPAAKSAASV